MWAGATAVLRPREHLLIWVMAGPSVIVSPRVGGGGPLGARGPPGLRGAHLPLGGAAPLARPAPHSSLCYITLPFTPPWLSNVESLAGECLAGLFGSLLPGGLASRWPAAGHGLASECLAGLSGGLLPGNMGHYFRGDSCPERAFAPITGGTTLRRWGRWRRRWWGRWRRGRGRG